MQSDNRTNDPSQALAVRKPAAPQELVRQQPTPAGRELAVSSESGGPPELTANQIAVLDGLLQGLSVTDAAAAAGVERTTIYLWRRKNYAFQAALTRGRHEMRESMGLRLEQLASDATECVQKAVRGGDVKAALELVKRMNLLQPLQIGSDDPTELRIEDEESREVLERREERLRDTQTLRGLYKR